MKEKICSGKHSCGKTFPIAGFKMRPGFIIDNLCIDCRKQYNHQLHITHYGKPKKEKYRAISHEQLLMDMKRIGRSIFDTMGI